MSNNPHRQPHNFHRSLQRSKEASLAPFWSAVYEKAFNTLDWHRTTEQLLAEGFIDPDLYKTLQLRGVDRLLSLQNGVQLTVDEKDRNRTDDSDILLEFESAHEYGTPGWVEKDLTIDYLAYAFIPLQRCYIFDWRMLRRAWQAYGTYWKSKYFIAKAQNYGYTTWSVAVPTSVLRQAISEMAVIQL